MLMLMLMLIDMLMLSLYYATGIAASPKGVLHYLVTFTKLWC